MRNTRTRDIMSCQGPLEVTEVTKFCPQHPGEVLNPEPKLTPPRSKYGFDLLSEIGRLRFFDHRQINEIHTILNNRRIFIPERTIENLTHRFLKYAVAVHLESLPQLATLLNSNGGYVLQLDGTTTCGTPTTLLIKDGFSEIRLLAASIPTESCEHVQPHIEMVQKHFGIPICAIRDGGDGIRNAFLNVFPEVYVITCHYHFLKNVGERLLGKKYRNFQAKVHQTGILKRLRAFHKDLKRKPISEETEMATLFVDRILSFKKDGKGLSFPFSVSTIDFYRRCLEIQHKVQNAIRGRAQALISSPNLIRLKDILSLLQSQSVINDRIDSEYLQLTKRWLWFERIRKTLRYRNGPIPLNTRGYLSTKELEDAQKELDVLLKDIMDFCILTPKCEDSSLQHILRGLSELLMERRDELFAPNVEITANGRKEFRKLPRTNNAVEQDFRKVRRYWRRIMGNNNVESNVQKQAVGQALIENVKISEYVRVVYGRIEKMASRFSVVTPEALQEAKALMHQ